LEALVLFTELLFKVVPPDAKVECPAVLVLEPVPTFCGVPGTKPLASLL
jgi:hypothetical protein